MNNRQELADLRQTQEDVDDYKDWLKLTSEEREAKQKEMRLKNK